MRSLVDFEVFFVDMGVPPRLSGGVGAIRGVRVAPSEPIVAAQNLLRRILGGLDQLWIVVDFPPFSR